MNVTLVMKTLQIAKGQGLGLSRTRWVAALCAVVMMGAVSMPSPAMAKGAPDSFADLADKLSPAVVNVSTSRTVEDAPEGQIQGQGMPQFPPGSPFEELFKDYFDHYQGPNGKPPKEHKTRSLGSGFVIDSKGLIVTNNHVIDKATEIVVSFQNGKEFPAHLIGRDVKTDIALLKVDAPEPLPSVKLGDSDKVRVGDWVLAIGNPFGLGGTVTAGIISAGNRDIHAGPYDNFLQTDASINRGNSGGPMFNMDGEVIGVNSMIYSPTGGSVGIGFAIPSETVKLVIKDIEKFGHVRRGWLGVVIQNVSEDIAASLGMESPKGALVQQVSEGSPADKAGIVAGDVVVEFNNKSVDEMRRLPRIVAETDIGTSVPVKVFRNGKIVSLKVHVGELKDTTKVAKAKSEPKHAAKTTAGKEVESLGIVVAKITPAYREKFELSDKDTGVVITSVTPKSSADKKGFVAGMVIGAVTQRPVKSPKDVIKAVKKAEKAGRPSVLLQVRRGDQERFIALKIAKD